MGVFKEGVSKAIGSGITGPNLIVMVGPPACGKSTLSKKLAEATGAKVVSSDEVRKDILGDESIQKNNEAVFEEVYSRLEDLGSYGQDAILDSTNCSGGYRKEMLKRLRKTFGRVFGVCYNGPVYTCISRNAERDRVVPEDVIIRMHDAMRGKNRPSLEDGFDCLMTFDEAMIEMGVMEETMAVKKTAFADER